MDRIRFLQYIGARYVPKFYVNSQNPDSSEWEPNVDYEYMTWVSLPNGAMYLSKENVPASVGSPVNNPRYWMTAGQFNAYIQQIQTEINDMKDGTIPGSLQDQINDNTGDISALNSSVTSFNNYTRTIRQAGFSNVIAIGDSWGCGRTGENGWDYYLPTMFKGEHLYTNCQGGYGWTRSGLQFITLLQNIASSIPDPNKIDLVIIAGGINDAVGNPTQVDITNAMAAVRNYVVATYPNAICVGVGLNPHYGYNETDMLIKRAAGGMIGKAGIFYYVDYTDIIPPSWYDSDGIHLDPNKYGVIAGLLAEIITGHVDTKATLADNWAVTRYSSSTLKNSNNDYIDVSQRKVGGQREIKIELHTNNEYDYFTFNTNLAGAAIKSYLNFTELVSGIDMNFKEPIPFDFLARSTATGTYFDITANGNLMVTDVGQPNNAVHIEFIVNTAMPFTMQRLAARPKNYVVAW